MAKSKRVSSPIAPVVNYPQRIRFTSDDTELELIESKIVNGFTMVYYKYTKSITKLGQLLPILDIHLKGSLESTFCTIIPH